MSVEDPGKPAFLQCCLVCNIPVPSADNGPPRSVDGVDLRQLLVGHVSPAARDELAIVEAVCAHCLASLQQWDEARQKAGQLHQALATRYRTARQRRAACVLNLHLERLVLQIPYGVFLLNARGLADQPWPELVRRVTAAVLESAGIARPARVEPPPLPPGTRTVGCQTAADAVTPPAAAGARSEGTKSETFGQPRQVTARRPRGSPRRPAMHPSCSAQQQQSPLPGFLRGWEGITNVQPSAPSPSPAGAQKRVGFEDLREQAACARDLEETLSILSVADTASLLDRTETLSVFSDTADLSTLADDTWQSRELSGIVEPDEPRLAAKGRDPESAPSVSFAEPSAGTCRTARSTIDKGEDLLREFAETMSNISEGVVLEDLEGYFEEIDRPCLGGGRPAPSTVDVPSNVSAAAAVGVADPVPSPPASAAQCPVCHKMFRHRRFLRPHLRQHGGSLFRCERCDTPFIHYYKLQLHRRRRHGLPLKAAPTSATVITANTTTTTGTNTTTSTNTTTGTNTNTTTNTSTTAADPPPTAQQHDTATTTKLTCADCGRHFSHPTTLRQHERLHRGDGYPCTHCGKVFPSKSELSRHADSHQAEKLYKCEECGRAFQVSSSLARHRTLHTDRAARCDLCGKGFDRKDTMLKHRETHKASNEHPCHICGKMYKQRRILAKHIKLIHGGPGEHVCLLCDKPFRTKYDLSAHTRRVHRKSEPVRKLAPPAADSMCSPEPVLEPS